MLKKNDVVELSITDVTAEGFGVGKYEGMAVFVKEALPGETVKAKIVKVLSGYCYAIIDKLIIPAKERIEPPCPHFKQCGGCLFQHTDYAGERAFKENWVQSSISRIGKCDLKVESLIPSPQEFHYRNKAQYPFCRDKNGKIRCGFYAPRSHRAIPAEDCMLQPEFFTDICNIVCDFANEYNISIYDEATGKGLLRHLYIRYAEATDTAMVCIVANGRDIPDKFVLIGRLTDRCKKITSIILNVNTKNTNVITGKENIQLFGDPVITDSLCGVDVDISPLSFYQVNHKGAEVLYNTAYELTGLSDGDVLLDLYCGAGAIGLSMAKRHSKIKLIGVDIIESSIENARMNAKRAGINNAEFICADAGKASTILARDGLLPDVIVVDPPRKGCDNDTLTAISKMAPKRIVMISCNHATAARDINILKDMGYIAKKVIPVDMFPKTGHVECVILITKE